MIGNIRSVNNSVEVKSASEKMQQGSRRILSEIEKLEEATESMGRQLDQFQV